jgi:hypothetical protein
MYVVYRESPGKYYYPEPGETVWPQNIGAIGADVSGPADEEHVDGSLCGSDIAAADGTPDGQLPAASGGVAGVPRPAVNGLRNIRKHWGPSKSGRPTSARNATPCCKGVEEEVDKLPAAVVTLLVQARRGVAASRRRC